MNTIITAALDRPRTVLLLLALLLTSGVFAYQTIPRESTPDIDIPVIYVSISHDGISPDDSTRLLILPMEKELSTVENVREMTSIAYGGGGNVTLEFQAGFDADQALRDVQEAVDKAKSELPDESDDPVVHEVNLSLFPVVVITLAGDVPERTLLQIANDLQDKIEGMPEILEARIAGDREEVIEIVADPVIVESYQLDMANIIGSINRSNRQVASGSLDTGAGRYGIKVDGLIENAAELYEIPVKFDGDAVTSIGDIGTVRRKFKDPTSFARSFGESALTIEVVRRVGTNAIETVDNVRALVKETSRTWPETVQYNFTQDDSINIKRMLFELQNNIVSAILLIMIVAVWALGWRSSALIAVAIPSSFLTALVVLQMQGLTLNMVVLFSLILAVGMLVDGAIVVTEYADRKMMEGASRYEAYRAAATRMAWPITSSTLTTLAAFIPLMFWSGIVGEFIKFVPITLIATLSASLLMALIFVPTLGSLFGKPAVRRNLTTYETDGVLKLEDFTGASLVYIKVLKRVLRHPVKILFLALAVLVGVQIAYANYGKGVEYFPQIEPDEAIFIIHARGNLSIWEKDSLVREVERRILELDEFESVYTTVGNVHGRSSASDEIGSINVAFREWDKRRPAYQIFTDVQERVADLAGVYVESQRPARGPAGSKPIDVQLASSNVDVLHKEADRIHEHMLQTDGFKDVEDSRPFPGYEWRISINRSQAAKFGADVVSIGQIIKLITNGVVFTSMRLADSKDSIDVVARFPSEWRTLDQLDELRIQTPLGTVPLSNFVTRSPVLEVGQVERANGARVVNFRSDIEEGYLADTLVGELEEWIKNAGFDPRVEITFRGDNEDQAEAFDFLVKAFGVSLFVMAIIFVTQFNSFYLALLILSAVVMSTTGVMIGLLATGEPYVIVMSSIGVIALAGIVVNNNIVLIDTFIRLRRVSRSPIDAIVLTGAQRLRPVCLTMITTILGLMPMVMQANIDFFAREVKIGAPSTQWWVALSSAIVFGLAFATVLTLVVTPCALMASENYKAWRSARRQRRKERIAAREAAVSTG